jgi:hypothetical protein
VLRGNSITSHPRRIEQPGPLTIEQFSLSNEAQGWTAFEQIKLHRELADLAPECRDRGLMFVDQRCFDLFASALAGSRVTFVKWRTSGWLARCQSGPNQGCAFVLQTTSVRWRKLNPMVNREESYVISISTDSRSPGKGR